MSKDEIHIKRYSADPMYRILFAPETIEENVCFIDKLLELAIVYIQKRYGPKLMEGKVINRVFTLLLSNDDETIATDYKIKQFALLFIMQYEREFADRIAEWYTEGGLFENEGPNQFRRFMCKMEEYMDKTLNFAYHKSNIVGTINEFTREAAKEYIMK
mgnify:CR=1 FL=1